MAERSPTAQAAIDNDHIERSILALLTKRHADASICPSEVARDVTGDDETLWRPLMPEVRAVAADLAGKAVIVITRGEVNLAPSHLEGGPIRLRRGPRFQGP